MHEVPMMICVIIWAACLLVAQVQHLFASVDSFPLHHIRPPLATSLLVALEWMPATIPGASRSCRELPSQGLGKVKSRNTQGHTPFCVMAIGFLRSCPHTSSTRSIQPLRLLLQSRHAAASLPPSTSRCSTWPHARFERTDVASLR
jgi:hypothetical protein